MPLPKPSLLSTTVISPQEKLTVDRLLKEIASDDAESRTNAWRHAGEVGASAINPLADLMSDEDLEVARAAKRGIWQIVRHSSRPEAGAERAAVQGELLQLVQSEKPDPVLVEVLWMLSEIGNEDSVPVIAALLSQTGVREDTRMALERIPGDSSLAALKEGFKTVPEEFKANVAQSLRVRGVEVSGYPCSKLVPSKQTEVQPIK